MRTRPTGASPRAGAAPLAGAASRVGVALHDPSPPTPDGAHRALGTSARPSRYAAEYASAKAHGPGRVILVRRGCERGRPVCAEPCGTEDGVHIIEKIVIDDGDELLKAGQSPVGVPGIAGAAFGVERIGP